MSPRSLEVRAAVVRRRLALLFEMHGLHVAADVMVSSCKAAGGQRPCPGCRTRIEQLQQAALASAGQIYLN